MRASVVLPVTSTVIGACPVLVESTVKFAGFPGRTPSFFNPGP